MTYVRKALIKFVLVETVQIFQKQNPSMIFYFQENILFRRFSKIPIVPLSVIECIQKLRKKYESGES